MSKDSINNSDDRVVHLIWKSFESQTYNDLEDVVNAGKWFLQLLKLDNHQKDKLVDMTKDTLQKVLIERPNWKEIINQEIGWYSLYKLPNERTKQVTFSIKNDIINVLFSELLDSPEDIEKVENTNQYMEETRYRWGKVDPTADRVLRS